MFADVLAGRAVEEEEEEDEDEDEEEDEEEEEEEEDEEEGEEDDEDEEEEEESEEFEDRRVKQKYKPVGSRLLRHNEKIVEKYSDNELDQFMKILNIKPVS